jgi:hypothetical protein
MGYTPSAIRKILNDQLTSGQTVVAFCRVRDLKIPTFYSWKKKYPRLQAEGPAGFCQIVPNAGPVERRLRLPSGLELMITGLSTSEIAELILEIDRTYA